MLIKLTSETDKPILIEHSEIVCVHDSIIDFPSCPPGQIVWMRSMERSVKVKESTEEISTLVSYADSFAKGAWGAGVSGQYFCK